MKKLIPILLLIFIILSSCERKSGRKNVERSNINTCICENILCDYCVKVVAITDGDTFKGLTENNEEIKFRIHGIDAPEKKQAFGTKSKEKLSELIFNKQVGITVQTKRDRYGRPVVWVFTPEGKDVSAEMLKSGMAWHYKKYDDSRQYADIENEAREKKIGLWADANPIEPWNFRK